MFNESEKANKMKKIKILAITTIIILSMTMTSFAGWCKNTIGWYYEYGPKTVYTNGWYWIDGNNDGISECYYFDSNGYLLTDTVTPDGYTVDKNGCWTADGKVISIRTQVIEVKEQYIVAPPQPKPHKHKHHKPKPPCDNKIYYHEPYFSNHYVTWKERR